MLTISKLVTITYGQSMNVKNFQALCLVYQINKYFHHHMMREFPFPNNYIKHMLYLCTIRISINKEIRKFLIVYLSQFKFLKFHRVVRKLFFEMSKTKLIHMSSIINGKCFLKKKTVRLIQTVLNEICSEFWGKNCNLFGLSQIVLLQQWVKVHKQYMKIKA